MGQEMIVLPQVKEIIHQVIFAYIFFWSSFPADYFSHIESAKMENTHIQFTKTYERKSKNQKTRESKLLFDYFDQVFHSPETDER